MLFYVKVVGVVNFQFQIFNTQFSERAGTKSSSIKKAVTIIPNSNDFYILRMCHQAELRNGVEIDLQI